MGSPDLVRAGSGPRIALAHDWLTGMGGGERVLLALKQLYPEAPIFTSVYNPDRLPEEFRTFDIRTSWLQRVPLAKRKHQLFPLLRAKAFESFEFDDFDIVISDSSSDAKGIRVNPRTTLHICYCHTPTRYYWSHYEDYRRRPGFGRLDPLIRPVIPLLVRRMRRWDYAAAQRVDLFIANSVAVKRRIKKYYGRDSVVIFPPVDFERFELGNSRRSGLLAVGRQIAYKRFDLAVLAANRLNLPLTVVGDGPERQRLGKLAGPTVRFIKLNDRQLAETYAAAELLLFPGEEDAGIVPLEAMASGTPVVAYARGGALESVVDGQTGVLFKPQSVEGLCAAIQKAGNIKWDRPSIRSHAEQFSRPRFQLKISDIVARRYAAQTSESHREPNA